ncbi:hypothetical protein D3C80_1486720 [compost metagenome]
MLNTGQLHGFRRITVGQRDLACIGRLQRFGHLCTVVVLLDQQLLITFQGLDLLPVDRNRPGVLRLDQQLAAVEEPDLATQAITVLQPDGVGECRRASREEGEA